MDFASTNESSQSQQEVKTSLGVDSGKEKFIPSQFQRAKVNLTSFSSGIRKAFKEITTDAPLVDLDAEIKELDYLSERLAKLTVDTAQQLDLSPTTKFASDALEQVSVTANRKEDQVESEVVLSPEVLDRRQRVVMVLQDLQKQAQIQEQEIEYDFERVYPVSGILCDTDKIDEHQIDLIQQKDSTAASFKMTSAMGETFKKEILPHISEEMVSDGNYKFPGNIMPLPMGDAWIIKVDDVTTIQVSKGAERVFTFKERDYTKPIRDEFGHIVDYERSNVTHPGIPVRALEGAVQIQVEGITDAQLIVGKIDNAFSFLGIPDALVTPDQQAENKYKEARYRWQHRLEDDQKWEEHKEEYKDENGEGLIDHLKRQEVYPGYYTIVDPGAHERYQHDGKLFLLHKVGHTDPKKVLPSILQRGLLSTHERTKRGINSGGMSPDKDFRSGGADSVFMRLAPAILSNVSLNSYPSNNDFHLLINPEVLDRTDWYAYNVDKYGTIEPSEFDARPTVEEFISEQRKSYCMGNEIMMRRGIPPEMISGILARSDEQKTTMIEVLRVDGMQEINGVSLDDFITVSPNSSLKEVISRESSKEVTSV